MRAEFFKELYYRELERKEHVNNRFNWTVGIFIIFIGANIYCLNLMLKLNEIQWAMKLLYGCTTLGMFAASIFLAIPLWAKKVSHLPLASQLNNHYSNLRNHYANEENIDKLVNEAFNNYLVDIYIPCTESNTNLSDEKMKMTSLGNVAMIISLVFLLLTYVVIAPSEADQEELYKVLILEGGETHAGK
ncbi:hypothetical protein [Sporosarcina sp. G11-34]|uniref:hypothetical protein n=1 Tax=Sporosarcina sp. G11-34 TaxID=2849605 RepID=UPI0022A9116B|nr:hypothetical protein [Sporosarcina sp. G11-34]MCZ2259856.1 hypothetical protein [Sporosarcina sp. G11-34]